ncbi:hypothetical protein ACFOVU_27905 [Nocardiopsis sediminis]|uniref:DUF4129 domain-containing protein n=1 Tax=Nocardiopsis sediminis TaxID=1778267 RepID=A0ABV8FUD8_9ACTN
MTNFIIFSACGLWIASALLVALTIHARTVPLRPRSTQARRLMRAIPRAAGPGADVPVIPPRRRATVRVPVEADMTATEITRPYLLWERFQAATPGTPRDCREEAAHLVRPYIIGTPHQLAAANEDRRHHGQDSVEPTLAERTLAGLQELQDLNAR